MRDIKAVVFDLYGTLIYLSSVSNKAYARLFSDLGLAGDKEAGRIALTEDFDDLDSLVRRVIPNICIDPFPYEQQVKSEVSSAQLYPETIKVLSELREKGSRIGLISNLASPFKAPFFDLALDRFFDEVLFSCEVGLMKPNPAIYQKMLDCLGIDPVQALMIGDNFHADVKGPRLAGMNAVYLDRSKISSGSISTLEGIFQYM